MLLIIEPNATDSSGFLFYLMFEYSANIAEECNFHFDL
jgi:hypothetical protein